MSFFRKVVRGDWGATVKKVANSKNLATVLPLTSFYTKAGRTALADSFWGKAVVGAASIYGGAGAGQLASNVVGKFATPPDAPARTGGDSGGEGGGFVVPAPAPAAVGNIPWPLIIGAGVVGLAVIVILVRK